MSLVDLFELPNSSGMYNNSILDRPFVKSRHVRH
jgi:hypothetical protein